MHANPRTALPFLSGAHTGHAAARVFRGGTPGEPGDAAAAVSETRCFDLRKSNADGIYDLKAIFQKG